MGTAVEASLRYISCGDTWVNPVAPRENISATVSRELAEHHLLTPARGKSCPTSPVEHHPEGISSWVGAVLLSLEKDELGVCGADSAGDQTFLFPG